MQIETAKGEGILEKIYFTELGHVMAKIFNQKTKIWTNVRIGSLEDFLKDSDIQIKGVTNYRKTCLDKITK